MKETKRDRERFKEVEMGRKEEIGRTRPRQIVSKRRKICRSMGGRPRMVFEYPSAAADNTFADK